MGETRPSSTKYLLENQAKEGLSDNELAYITGSMFGGGADTVSLYRFRNVSYTSSDRPYLLQHL